MKSHKSKVRPVVDIVIGCAGRFDMLEKCLVAIDKYATVPVSVIVVDDGSDKEKRNTYRYLFDGSNLSENIVNFSTKRHETPQGFPITNNVGARLGSAPLICFMNDDVEVTEGFFDVLVKTMQDPQVGVCGAKLVFPSYSTDPNRPAGKVQHIGIAVDVMGNAVHPLVGWSADNPKTCKSREVFAVTGACLVTRRQLFNKVGGFDKIYSPGYWEDADLALKIRQLGYKIIVNVNLLATHYTGSSSTISKSFTGAFHLNGMTFRSRWAQTGLLTFDSWSYG